MARTTFDNMASGIALFNSSLKSIAKIALQSRSDTITRRKRKGERLVVMGNGPSLKEALPQLVECQADASVALMAVNFAANAPEFFQLKPSYYLLADPHFFTNPDDANVQKLHQNLARVDWPMTLFVPVGKSLSVSATTRIECFNPVGIEGWRWLRHWAYASGRGMPRPRNVLIPAIMVGMAMGYEAITILGADHSWMKTLAVDDDNRVVSVQPHFYEEEDSERLRVTQVYRGVKLHDVIMSFYVAFRAYHDIAEYAESHGIRIVNATPNSMIDAFPRIKELIL